MLMLRLVFILLNNADVKQDEPVDWYLSHLKYRDRNPNGCVILPKTSKTYDRAQNQKYMLRKIYQKGDLVEYLQSQMSNTDIAAA